MKQCPQCRQTYSDPDLNFCLDDGEMLTAFTTEPPTGRYADIEPPPTVLLNQPRVTSPTNWPQPRQSGSPVPWQPQGIENAGFGYVKQDRTLPTAAMVI